MPLPSGLMLLSLLWLAMADEVENRTQNRGLSLDLMGAGPRSSFRSSLFRSSSNWDETGLGLGSSDLSAAAHGRDQLLALTTGIVRDHFLAKVG